MSLEEIHLRILQEETRVIDKGVEVREEESRKIDKDIKKEDKDKKDDKSSKDSKDIKEEDKGLAICFNNHKINFPNSTIKGTNLSMCLIIASNKIPITAAKTSFNQIGALIAGFCALGLVKLLPKAVELGFLNVFSTALSFSNFAPLNTFDFTLSPTGLSFNTLLELSSVFLTFAEL